jgi:hypothetical protein
LRRPAATNAASAPDAAIKASAIDCPAAVGPAPTSVVAWAEANAMSIMLKEATQKLFIPVSLSV